MRTRPEKQRPAASDLLFPGFGGRSAIIAGTRVWRILTRHCVAPGYVSGPHVGGRRKRSFCPPQAQPAIGLGCPASRQVVVATQLARRIGPLTCPGGGCTFVWAILLTPPNTTSCGWQVSCLSSLRGVVCRRAGFGKQGYEAVDLSTYTGTCPSRTRHALPSASSGLLELAVCRLSPEQALHLVVGGANRIAHTNVSQF